MGNPDSLGQTVQLAVLSFKTFTVLANPIITVSVAVVEVLLRPRALVVELGKRSAPYAIAPCLRRHMIDDRV